MICSNCGNSNKESTQYCTSCGRLVRSEDNGAPVRFDLYSKNWRKTKWGITNGNQQYDVAIDRDGIYIIVLPKQSSGTTGALIGFLLGSVIGLVIGMMWGNSSDEKKREIARGMWLGNDNMILSRIFESISEVTIARREGIESIKVVKKKLLVTQGGTSYEFSAMKKPEAQLLEQYLFTHGLSKM